MAVAEAVVRGSIGSSQQPIRWQNLTVAVAVVRSSTPAAPDSGSSSKQIVEVALVKRWWQ